MLAPAVPTPLPSTEDDRGVVVSAPLPAPVGQHSHLLEPEMLQPDHAEMTVGSPTYDMAVSGEEDFV